ncbi:Cytochrome C oxidase, cbb3-type, subunit III [Nitrosomonas cryotolerans]|uniref:Cytochrome C oxidase, cbb3-type, subunit III n=1 Tax=Nitrosomonas cryotolerans ATCC 49181 TaxID=1131553 RepID=A0A1N6F6P1_9PROT|nr:cytochrome c [Nitrosomonas cryotolerans]SFP98772.1 Cytochrome C oxidase, cbb3-type, subunit III [Nitrosomonas cryotolerans]SIN90953.1 Cytochrome C oxidase, cbb3-type, subunit III [Nitrosomonas cryotolerans ATCC 49181]
MITRYFLLISISGLLIACNDPAPSGNAPPQTPQTHETYQAQPRDSQEPLITRDFDPAQIKQGETAYRANCTGCHGQKGEAGPNWRQPGKDGRYPPPPLNGTAHTWHHTTEALKKTILKGGPPGNNGMPSGMPAWENKLTEQQVDDILVWIKSLWPDEIYDAWYRNIENKS